MQGGSELTEIEKRQLELDQKLYELANKHRKTYSKEALDHKSYRMPDAYDDEEPGKAASRDKRM